jgi:hypothetical protein
LPATSSLLQTPTTTFRFEELAMTRQSPVRLTAKLSYELTNFVGAEYEKAKCTDVDFATIAADKFATPINANHIATCRETLGIANFWRDGRHSAEGLTERVAAVETAIEVLEQKVRALQASMKEVVR